ncbi:hypothetical protein RH915_09775 [Serpentinicella sp. ANB-PHB4]|uniref:sulfatase-like hydrolase/transferase n=1 Tax=Serpentinicella sp. ANB-PHB4 TaxID=3074076 RepID=UPI002855B7A2|nr:sulfatase-like hydrolase/transferase [Serpentinicella sp. ANB-PHB4]MDR5659785.1 hypothetical protein [Serpentinicella sp. ANB-PHB4]
MLEELLESILQKYDMLHSPIQKTFLRRLDEIPSEQKIGIRGSMPRMTKILDYIPDKSKIKGLYDKDLKSVNQEIEGFKIKHADFIEKDSVDIAIIAHYNYKEEIMKELEDKNIKAIDIYQDFTKLYGIEITDFTYIEYNIIFRLKELYLKEQKTDQKQYYLKELINQYLHIKDFKYAINFIKEYIVLRYDNYHLFESLLVELNDFLLTVKREIAKKSKGQDISLFLLDGLKAKDVYGAEHDGTSIMKNLAKLSNENKHFTQAFSPSTFTREVITVILNEKHILYEDSELTNVELKDSMWIRNLIKKRYKLFINLMKNIIGPNDHFHNVKLNKPKYKTAPETFWELLIELYSIEEDSLFSFNHLYCESHEPYFCGNHSLKPFNINLTDIKTLNDQERKNILTQRRESLIYLDEQLEYFFDFLPNNHSIIVFSDHGAPDLDRNDSSRYECKESNIHVPLIVKSEYLNTEREDKLFSTIDLGKLILNLVNRKDTITSERHFVEIQLEPIYNKDIKNKLIKQGQSKLTSGFRAIRGKKDKYILWGDGTEEYYLISDESNNLIKSESYEDRIKCLKSKTDFI